MKALIQGNKRMMGIRVDISNPSNYYPLIEAENREDYKTSILTSLTEDLVNEYPNINILSSFAGFDDNENPKEFILAVVGEI